jgi:hypothetical protein
LASWAVPREQTRIDPVLNRLAGECGSLVKHLAAYVAVLALFAAVCIHLWDSLALDEVGGPVPKPGWSLATRSYPAFAVSQIDSFGKTVTYQIFRHPGGGRKDVLHWVARDGQTDGRPVAALEIYRPGGEWDPSGSDVAEVAARMDPDGSSAIEEAGLIDSKFGMVKLIHLAGSGEIAGSCLGFIKHIDMPNLQISGWSCQGGRLPAQRAAIGCMLNRLVLLSAGNEPKMADLFAQAELKRGTCAANAPASADWVTSAENPRLRGAL